MNNRVLTDEEYKGANSRKEKHLVQLPVPSSAGLSR